MKLKLFFLVSPYIYKGDRKNTLKTFDIQPKLGQSIKYLRIKIEIIKNQEN
jgi:hypothetical protein